MKTKSNPLPAVVNAERAFLRSKMSTGHIDNNRLGEHRDGCW